MKWLRGRGIAVAVVCSMLSSGCYDWELIKPTEIPKLNGSFATPVGRTGDTTVVAVRVANVEREDGTLAQIKGNFDLKVVRENGDEVEFEHPVAAEMDGDDLVIRGGNRARTHIPMYEIKHAEVSQLDPGATTAAAVICSVVGGLVVAGVAVAFANKRP
jgi:hypothetical protein